MRTNRSAAASRRPALLLAAVAAAASLCPTPAARATYTWTNFGIGFWSDSFNWSSNAVPDSANDAALTLAGNYTSFITGDQSAHDLAIDYTTVAAEIYSSSDYGFSSLTVHDANLFAGSLKLTANDNYQTTLTATDAINIHPLGNLNLLASTSGSAFYTVNGDVNNAGSVTVDAYSTFTSPVTNTGSFSIGANQTAAMYHAPFYQTAGTLTVNPGSTLHLDNGGFAFTGGSISNSAPVTDNGATTGTAGAVLLTGNSSLLTTVPDGGNATFSAFSNLSLASDLSPHTNLMLSANATRGYANLYTGTSFTNHGTISCRADDNYSVQLVAGDGTGTITNPATLNFSTNGAGTSSAVFVNANLVNPGTLNASVTTVFKRNVTNTGAINLSNNAQLSTAAGVTFNQNAGTLGTTGADRLNLSGNTFNLNGGQVKLTLYATGNNTLNLNVSDGQGLVVNASGNLTLGTAFRANTTLNLTAGNNEGYSNLYVNDNASNFGHLFLHDNDLYSADIHTPSNSGNFNNAGLLEFNTNGAGSHGSSHFYGTFVNTPAGTLNADADLYFTANASNAGSFNVGNNATLHMSNARFNQDAGNLGNSGQTHFAITNGGFNYGGGTLALTVDFTGNSYLSTAVGNAGGAAFNFFGGNAAIHGNLAFGANVFSLANSTVGYANLYVDNAAANYGSITLSAANNYTDNLYPGNGSAGNTFSNYGTLNLNATPGSSISVGGNLHNYGTLNVSGHATFTYDFSNSSGATLAVSGTDSTLILNGNLTPGGSIVAQGGGNIVGQGGGNIVGQGGGNIVGQGGGNILAQGGGNIVGQGGGNIISQDGNSLVGTSGGGSVISNDGGTLTARNGGTISAFVGHNGSAEPSGVVASATTSSSSPSPSSSSPADPPASIVAHSGGSIQLQNGILLADNAIQIDAGATLSGFGIASASIATSSGTINLTPANTTLTLHAPLTLSNASITGPGKLLITAPLTISSPSTISSTIIANSLTLSAPLDLTTSTLTLITATPDDIRQDLFSHQLFSSTADNTHSLAYHVNPDNSLTLLFTFTGDTNLDGQLDPDDYALLDRSFARHTPNPHWTDGDFNYDGIINTQDYLLLDTSFGQAQGFSPGFLSQRESQFGEAYVQSLIASVPEPTSLLTACGFALPLLSRRRIVPGR